MNISDELILMAGLVVMPAVCAFLVLTFAAPLWGRYAAGRESARTAGIRPSSRLYYGTPMVVPGVALAFLSTFALWALSRNAAVGSGLLTITATMFVPILRSWFVGVQRGSAVAKQTWARDSGLSNHEILLGVREISLRSQWRWLVFSLVPCALMAGMAVDIRDGSPAASTPTFPFALICVVLAMVLFRAVDAAFPVAGFLTAFGAAMGPDQPAMPIAVGIHRQVVRHQSRIWGDGGAALLQSLPSLRRCVLAHLRDYPALCERSVLLAVTPLFDELKNLAVNGHEVTPTASTRRALRLALNFDLGPVMRNDVLSRSLGDDAGWNQSPNLWPGDLGGWAPRRLARFGALITGLVAGVATVMGLAERI